MKPNHPFISAPKRKHRNTQQQLTWPGQWALGCLAGLTLAALGADPDLGPDVMVFSPGQADAQQRIHAVFSEMEAARFTGARRAILFKPGEYQLDVPVGFYTHVAGLGRKPGETRITGAVRATAKWMGFNATCNFWRVAENLKVIPDHPNRVNLWSASQAAPMRRMHIEGDLKLMEDGWASGGFLAQCRIDGKVLAGSQQQYFARNCSWREWTGGAWSMVLVGNLNPPAEDWPNLPYTVVEQTPLVRDKPWLFIDGDGNWKVAIPKFHAGPTQGISHDESPAAEIPLADFHIARPGNDNSTSMNAALTAGKHLLLTPGQYPLAKPIIVTRPGTVLLGLGLPTLRPTAGNPCVLVDAGEGVILSGLMLDAGEPFSETLLRVGSPGRKAGSATNPTSLHDVFIRVGGPGPGGVRNMVEIHDDHVIGDNLWLWRADHGKGVGWTSNPNETGLVVTGAHVTCYGLAVEHTQGRQVVWSGEDGQVFFFQSEMPYDPPSQDQWMYGTSRGFPAYWIDPKVRRHQAVGMGVYHVFKKAPVMAAQAIEAPEGAGIRLRRMFTVRLAGGQPGSDIEHVLNRHTGQTHPRMAIIRTLDPP